MMTLFNVCILIYLLCRNLLFCCCGGFLFISFVFEALRDPTQWALLSATELCVISKYHNGDSDSQ